MWHSWACLYMLHAPLISRLMSAFFNNCLFDPLQLSCVSKGDLAIDDVWTNFEAEAKLFISVLGIVVDDGASLFGITLRS